MSRYIDADELINKINAYVINSQDVMYIRELIKETPTADVREVKKMIILELLKYGAIVFAISCILIFIHYKTLQK